MTKLLTKLFVFIIFSAFSISAYSQNKVVIIPMAGDDIAASAAMKNVIRVSAENGDFSDPLAALSSITDAGEDNRYLVVIGPGNYDLGSTPLNMKPYVDIRGSGQNVTRIAGSISHASDWHSAALIFGADNATLSNLMVENTATTGTLSAAIFNVGSSPTLRNVTLKVHDDGQNRIPVHNTGGASPRIFDSELLTAVSSNGLYSYNGCEPLVVGSYIKGIVYSQRSSTKVEHSYIEGNPPVRTDGYPSTGGTADIFASTLDGTIPADAIRGGTLPKCAGVADENNVFYAGPVCP